MVTAAMGRRTAPAFLEWLESLNMSARKLAAYTGVSNSTASQWLRGAVPERESVQKLADGLNVPVDRIEALIKGEIDKDEMPKVGRSLLIDDPNKFPDLLDISNFHPTTIGVLRNIGDEIERKIRLSLLEGIPPKQVAEDEAEYESDEDETDLEP